MTQCVVGFENQVPSQKSPVHRLHAQSVAINKWSVSTHLHMQAVLSLVLLFDLLECGQLTSENLCEERGWMKLWKVHREKMPKLSNPWGKLAIQGTIARCTYRVFDNFKGCQSPDNKEAVGRYPWSAIVLNEGLQTLRGCRQDVDTIPKVEVQSVVSERG